MFHSSESRASFGSCDVYQKYEHFVRQFERHLQNARVTHAEQRRMDDPNAIFQDLKAGPQHPQPDAFTLKSKVVEIDADGSLIEPPQRWNPDLVQVGSHMTLMLNQTVAGPQCELGTASQEHYIGHVTELFQRFGHEWQKRWDRHRDVDDEFWSPILSQRYFFQGSTKAKKSATGPSQPT